MAALHGSRFPRRRCEASKYFELFALQSRVFTRPMCIDMRTSRRAATDGWSNVLIKYTCMHAFARIATDSVDTKYLQILSTCRCAHACELNAALKVSKSSRVKVTISLSAIVALRPSTGEKRKREGGGVRIPRLY